ncbi:hypothetical protein TNCV_4383041 [Trichonephila clavipes]|nr:hypothetical protein TNCV_4383041 [Trichonephila clavipes]
MDFPILQKDLVGMHPLYMILGSNGPGKASRKLRHNHVRFSTDREDLRIHHKVRDHRSASTTKLQVFFRHQRDTVTIVCEIGPSQTLCIDDDYI